MSRLFKIILITSVIICGACNQSGTDAVVDKSAPAGDKKYYWKMVTTWPANFPIFQEGAEKFAEDLRVMSGGRLNIQVFAGGELVPPLQVFDAVSQGTVEMGHGSAYYWAGKVPEAQFFSSVPFGMTAKGMHAWLYHGGGLALWQEIYRPFNLVPYPMGNTGIQMGGWFNKKIESMEDIKGLRMRIPGLGGKVLKKAGGNPVLIAGAEIYTALERGTIDATEWVGPFHDQRLGLNRTARYYYYPGWHEPGTEFELIINANDWSELPADLKKMIEMAAMANGEWIYSHMEYSNQSALQVLEQNGNVEILEFPEEVIAEFRQMTNEALLEESATRPKFKKIYEAYQDFSHKYAEWDALTDESYMRALRR